MGYNEDFGEGYRNGGWSNQPGAEAMNAGARAAQRDREFAESQERQRRHDAAQAAAANQTNGGGALGYQPAPPLWGDTHTSGTRGHSGGGGMGSLGQAAKTGAVGLAVVFGLYVLMAHATWTWPHAALGALAAAVVGAVAGAALYIAVQMLVMALKLAAVLLAVGVVLHLLGALDLFGVLAHLRQLLM